MPTKRDARRREIQKLAADLFMAGGYDAVSVRDLADAAGVTLPTLYWYIGSKQKLLAAIYESMQQENFERFSRVGATDLAPDLKLRALLREGFELNASRREEAIVYRRERFRLDQDYFQSQIPKRLEVDQIVKDVLDEGVRQELWPDTHVRAARMTFWATINFLLDWFHPEGSLTVEEVADQFAELLIGGLRASSALERRGSGEPGALRRARRHVPPTTASKLPAG